MSTDRPIPPADARYFDSVEFARILSESVAALAMLKDQVCGMYAVLEQKGKSQSDHVQALVNAESVLQQLLGKFPKDPVTLGAINHASARIETVAERIPGDVRALMNGMGSTVAGVFSDAVKTDLEKINNAATWATKASDDYAKRVRRSYWATALVASGVIVATVAVLVGAAFYWWIPARADLEAQRAERERLTAVIAQLKQQGGNVQIVLCETRLCVRTDESGKTPKVADLKKGETYRVIKGY